MNPNRTSNRAWFTDILACPQCKRAIERYNDNRYRCDDCQITFPTGPLGQPDLRLSKPLEISLPTKYDPSLIQIPENLWTLPSEVSNYLNQAKQLSGRPQANIKAWLLATVKPGNVVLDLGAKSNRDKELIESLGANYLAIEINAPDAMLLGDAHAIPLIDQSVDVVMCMSVFEHLKNPFLAAQEIKRILKPGGHLIGIVGFLEGVHGLPHGSYFHHSYFGIYTVLTATDLKVNYLSIDMGWLAIHSIGRAMLPGVPKKLVYAIISPLRWFQNIVWYLYGVKSGDIEAACLKKDRILSASVHFVATNLC